MPPERFGRDFRLLFAADVSSSLANGMVRTAAPLLAVALTSDPLLVSGVAAAVMLPWLVFGAGAGLLVDLVDRRKALAVSNLLRTAISVTLLVLVSTGGLTPWGLLVVVFLTGSGETVYDSGMRAVLPGAVPRSGLARANARIEGAQIVMQNFVAAPLTSLLIGVAVIVPLGLTSLAYALSAMTALALSVPAGRPTAGPAEGAGRARGLRQLADGFVFIRRDRRLVTLLGVQASIALCTASATSTLVLFLIEGFGLRASQFGLFMLTGSVGSVLGAVLAPRARARFGTGRSMAAANIVLTAPLIVAGLAPSLWVVAVALSLAAVGSLVFAVLGLAYRQALIPGRLLGRVHGSWRTALWGATPLGAVAGGTLARADLRLPFLVSGTLALALALVSTRFVAGLDHGDRIEVA